MRSMLPFSPSQPHSISDVVKLFAEDNLGAVAKDAPPPPLRTHKLGGGWEPADTTTALKITWDVSADSRRFMLIERETRMMEGAGDDVHKTCER